MKTATMLLWFALRPNGIRWYAVCMERAVAYLRVSTQQQQRSGLGIEAQRAAIERFVAAESLTIIEEYAEFETGKGADALDRRPQLEFYLPQGPHPGRSAAPLEHVRVGARAWTVSRQVAPGSPAFTGTGVGEVLDLNCWPVINTHKFYFATSPSI